VCLVWKILRDTIVCVIGICVCNGGSLRDQREER